MKRTFKFEAKDIGMEISNFGVQVGESKLDEMIAKKCGVETYEDRLSFTGNITITIEKYEEEVECTDGFVGSEREY